MNPYSFTSLEQGTGKKKTQENEQKIIDPVVSRKKIP